MLLSTLRRAPRCAAASCGERGPGRL